MWNVKKIRESGGVAIVLYPNQFEELKNIIELLKRGYNENVRLNQSLFDKAGWFE